jgi:HEAT repeats
VAAHELLLLALVIQGLAGVLALLAILSHALYLRWWERRYRNKTASGRLAIVEALDEGSLNPEGLSLLRSLPLRVQIAIFVHLAPNLSGIQRRRLTQLARDIGLLDRAERRCASSMWWRRLQGARLLTILGGGDSVLPAMFGDRRYEVRAQAAEWAADHPHQRVVENLVDMLGDEATLCRFIVQDSLLRLGSAAVEPLTSRLLTGQRSHHEVTAALRVAGGLSDPRLLAPALHLCADERAEVRALAVSVVGGLGGHDAIQVLLECLSDTSAEVRAAAARSLGRLEHWPVAAPLARLLRDEAWEVRREAGLALRALGTPGLLLLRRSLNDRDRFAADMAKQVLDLPDTNMRVSTP